MIRPILLLPTRSRRTRTVPGPLRIGGGVQSLQSKTSAAVSEAGERLSCEMKLDSSVEEGPSWRRVRRSRVGTIFLSIGFRVGDQRFRHDTSVIESIELQDLTFLFSPDSPPSFVCAWCFGFCERERKREENDAIKPHTPPSRHFVVYAEGWKVGKSLNPKSPFPLTLYS